MRCWHARNCADTGVCCALQGGSLAHMMHYGHRDGLDETLVASIMFQVSKMAMYISASSARSCVELLNRWGSLICSCSAGSDGDAACC